MDELSTYDPFASAADFAHYIGSPPLTGDRETRATDLLAAASLEIRKACEWQVWPLLAGDVLTLDGKGGAFRALPVSRVVAVNSVVENGTTLVEGKDYDWSADGILDRLGGAWWSRKRRGLVVNLDHGFSTQPPDLKMLAMQVAGRGWSVPLPVIRQQAGQVSLQVAVGQSGDVPVVALSAADLLRLKGYRGGYR